MLFLGTSETVGEFVDLFATLDRKSKLYQRKEDVHGAHARHGAVLPPPDRKTEPVAAAVRKGRPAKANCRCAS